MKRAALLLLLLLAGCTPPRAAPAPRVESRFALVETLETSYGFCELFEVKLTTGVLKNVLLCDEDYGVNATLLD